MKKVLILCTGNSCRSQMAQAIWQDAGNSEWMAMSAGSRPSGYVHPLALRSIEELGLPIDGLESKSVDLFVGEEIDLAVTVCDHAKEACPVLPGVKQTLHWPFEDPADATGSDDEKNHPVSKNSRSDKKANWRFSEWRSGATRFVEKLRAVSPRPACRIWSYFS